MNGCTNPAAVNYNPGALEEDYSCVYVEKHQGICYAFQDVRPNEVVDHSFTLSYSLEGKDWVFFHDYVPDFYFTTRDQLWNLKNRKIFRHNAGAAGVYFETSPKSFFIDAVFNFETEVILDSVNWISEIVNNQNQEVEFLTLTHLTIWNNLQCTGRIPLDQVFEDLQFDVRKINGLWSFNAIRDMVRTQGSAFLRDLFNNFVVNVSALDSEKPWFEQNLLQDKMFLLRFEFANLSGHQVIFHGADIEVSKAYR